MCPVSGSDNVRRGAGFPLGGCHDHGSNYDDKSSYMMRRFLLHDVDDSPYKLYKARYDRQDTFTRGPGQNPPFRFSDLRESTHPLRGPRRGRAKRPRTVRSSRSQSSHSNHGSSLCDESNSDDSGSQYASPWPSSSMVLVAGNSDSYEPPTTGYQTTTSFASRETTAKEAVPPKRKTLAANNQRNQEAAARPSPDQDATRQNSDSEIIGHHPLADHYDLELPIRTLAQPNHDTSPELVKTGPVNAQIKSAPSTASSPPDQHLAEEQHRRSSDLDDIGALFDEFIEMPPEDDDLLGREAVGQDCV